MILGESGCGKSTLLKIIAGLEQPTSGAVRIGDAVMTDVPPKDRRLAMVFQSYALYPHLKVWENISFPIKMSLWKYAYSLPLLGRLFRTASVSSRPCARPPSGRPEKSG